MSPSTACQRHPQETTRIFCGQCDVPICPKCWIPCEVGYKCPDCVHQHRSHLLQSNYTHWARAAVGTTVLVYAASWVLPWIQGIFIFFSLFAVWYLGQWCGDLLYKFSGRKMGREMMTSCWVAGLFTWWFLPGSSLKLVGMALLSGAMLETGAVSMGYLYPILFMLLFLFQLSKGFKV